MENELLRSWSQVNISHCPQVSSSQSAECTNLEPQLLANSSPEERAVGYTQQGLLVCFLTGEARGRHSGRHLTVRFWKRDRFILYLQAQPTPPRETVLFYLPKYSGLALLTSDLQNKGTLLRAGIFKLHHLREPGMSQAGAATSKYIKTLGPSLPEA